MKNLFLVSLIAVLAVFAFAATVSATNDLNVTDLSVSINGVDVTTSDTVAVFGGETIPVRVTFKALESAHDLRIKAEIRGKQEISSKTERFFPIEQGSIYTKVFSLTVPKDIDVSKAVTLKISIYDGNGNEFEESYKLKLQRESYNVDILSADMDREVEAGTSLPVDIVIKNRGYERLDDLYVTVSIPKLGIEKRAYFEDMTPTDENLDNGKDDSQERRIYVNIPVSAGEGLYDVQVTAYNSDTEARVTKTISVIGIKAISEILVPSVVKEMATGETAVYNIVIINRGASLGVYEIVPESVDNMFVSVDEPVVTVPAGSSKSISVKVKAGNAEGTYNIGINVNSDGKTVKKANLTANVANSNKIISSTRSNMTILTVVLAIIFVVLLLVLIILLTRKPSRAEDIEESYY